MALGILIDFSVLRPILEREFLVFSDISSGSILPFPLASFCSRYDWSLDCPLSLVTFFFEEDCADDASQKNVVASATAKQATTALLNADLIAIDLNEVGFMFSKPQLG